MSESSAGATSTSSTSFDSLALTLNTRDNSALAWSRGDRMTPISKREKHAIWWVLEFTVIPIMWLMVGIKRYGSHNVPREGAFVISPNHTSNIDPIVMGIGVFLAGRTPHFLGKASLFKVPALKWLLRVTGQIPVDRTRTTRESDPLSAAALVTQSGSGVIVYPEGTLTRDPDLWPMRGKTGAVRLALTAGIPLIPAAHWGTEQFLPPYAKFPHLIPRKRIRIVFGPPVDLSG